MTVPLADRGTEDTGVAGSRGIGLGTVVSALGALIPLPPLANQGVLRPITVNAAAFGSGLWAGAFAGVVPRDLESGLAQVGGTSYVASGAFLLENPDDFLAGAWDACVDEVMGWIELGRAIISPSEWPAFFAKLADAARILFGKPELAFYAGYETGHALAGPVAATLRGVGSDRGKIAYEVGRILGPILVELAGTLLLGTGAAKFVARIGKEAGAELLDRLASAVRRGQPPADWKPPASPRTLAPESPQPVAASTDPSVRQAGSIQDATPQSAQGTPRREPPPPARVSEADRGLTDPSRPDPAPRPSDADLERGTVDPPATERPGQPEANRLPSVVVDPDAILDDLIDDWADEYRRLVPDSEIVIVEQDGFSYLFDIKEGRLISAWGISGGKHTGPRPAGRMQGHPLGAEEGYHRGHAIAHTLGGGTDINLVPQLGSVNIGPFRVLEKRAVATPGAGYFSNWKYDLPGQKPTSVQQGLLVPGEAPDVRTHVN